MTARGKKMSLKTCSVWPTSIQDVCLDGRKHTFMEKNSREDEN